MGERHLATFVEVLGGDNGFFVVGVPAHRSQLGSSRSVLDI